MPIASVNQMVRNRLQFLAAGDPVDATIDQFRLEAEYMLQTQSVDVITGDIELEASYPPLWNIMFAAMVAYWMIQRKAIETIAGVAGGAGGGAKILKRAKADVTEAEFQIVKASDGSLIQIDTNDLLKQFQKEACDIAFSMNVANPICDLSKFYNIPAFVKGCNYPEYRYGNIDRLLDGTPIGN